MKIDLSDAMGVLDKARQTVSDLDGVDWDDSESYRNSKGTNKDRERKAQINRDMMHLADQLYEAAAAVKREYWKGKGLR